MASFLLQSEVERVEHPRLELECKPLMSNCLVLCLTCQLVRGLRLKFIYRCTLFISTVHNVASIMLHIVH